VRAGLAQGVQILRGKDVSVNDVRAAIEYTTGKNLAEPFRVWLYSPGMPESFRKRYVK
jgi:aminopeptidase N